MDIDEALARVGMNLKGKGYLGITVVDRPSLVLIIKHVEELQRRIDNTLALVDEFGFDYELRECLTGER